MSELLKKNFVNSNELETLLNKREEGSADFILVDVREEMEYNMGHIKGVDMLKPTSSFQAWAQSFVEEYKDKAVILTCRTSSRTKQVQSILQQNGMTNIIDHFGGILSYRGEVVKP